MNGYQIDVIAFISIWKYIQRRIWIGGQHVHGGELILLVKWLLRSASMNWARTRNVRHFHANWSIFALQPAKTVAFRPYGRALRPCLSPVFSFSTRNELDRRLEPRFSHGCLVSRLPSCGLFSNRKIEIVTGEEETALMQKAMNGLRLLSLSLHSFSFQSQRLSLYFLFLISMVYLCRFSPFNMNI